MLTFNTYIFGAGSWIIVQSFNLVDSIDLCCIHSSNNHDDIQYHASRAQLHALRGSDNPDDLSAKG